MVFKESIIWFCNTLTGEPASTQVNLKVVSNELFKCNNQNSVLYATMDSDKKQLSDRINKLQGIIDIQDQTIQQQAVADSACQISLRNAQLLIKQLQNPIPVEGDALNNEHPKLQLHYANKRYIENEYHKKVYEDYDLTEFIFKNSWCLKQCVGQAFNLYHPKSEMETVSALWAWIMDDRGLGARYRPDDYFESYMNDFWQFPNETAELKKGDCEDLAILLVSLIRTAGIPDWKVRVDIGMYGEIGHAWGVYYDTTSKKWLLLEATQSHKFTDPLTTLESHTEYKAYYAFNDSYAWVIDSSLTFGDYVKSRDSIRGVTMGILDGIKAFWAAHLSLQKFVKYALYGGVIIAVQGIVSGAIVLPPTLELFGIVINTELFMQATGTALLLAVMNWAKHNLDEAKGVTGKLVSLAKKVG